MGNPELGKRIEERRKQLNLTLDDIASKIGVAKSTVQRYEKGTIAKIKLPVVESIARVLDVDPAWLCCKTDAMCAASDSPTPTKDVGTPIDYSKYRLIPILGRIPAGLPLLAEENIEGYTLTDLNGGADYFALRVKGDSMNAVGIMEGHILHVRKQPEVENGEIAVVMVGDEDATVKRFYSTAKTVTLMPQSTNPIHTPQIYDMTKTPIRVLGKVVKVEFIL